MYTHTYCTIDSVPSQIPIINAFVSSFMDRVRACVHAGGRHFPKVRWGYKKDYRSAPFPRVRRDPNKMSSIPIGTFGGCPFLVLTAASQKRKHFSSSADQSVPSGAALRNQQPLCLFSFSFLFHFIFYFSTYSHTGQKDGEAIRCDTNAILSYFN